MKASGLALRVLSGVGALIGYGCLLVFLYLVGAQVYRWFRDGQWTHIGLSGGLRTLLVHLGVKDGDTGRLAELIHWLDAPISWLGLHRIFEVVPASLALFAVSIAGNCLFIYCSDRLKRR